MAQSKPPKYERMLSDLKIAFDEADTDSDGKICKEQLEDLLDKVGFSPKAENMQFAFDLMDRDKSGDVCFMEFSQAVMDMELKKEEMMFLKLKQIFKQYDKGNDGYICKQDLRAVAKDGTPEEEIDEMLAKLDMDKDGKISFKEFVRGFPAMHLNKGK